jgi:ActR/RegA family two-component response regulator
MVLMRRNCTSYTSSNVRMIKLKRIRWERLSRHIEEMRNAFQDSAGKPGMKRRLGRQACAGDCC